MILNMKDFDKSVDNKKFKIDTLQFTLTLMIYAPFMASVDVLDTQHSAPIFVDL